MIVGALAGLAALVSQGQLPVPCPFQSVMPAVRADRVLIACRDRPELFALSSNDGRILRHLQLAGPQRVPVNNLAFSQDGQEVAVSWRDGTISIYSDDEDKPRTWHAGFYANSMVFSPDGRRLYVDGTELDTRTALPTGRSVRGEFDAPNAIAFDKDGRQAVVGEADTTVRLYDLASGNQVRSVDFDIEPLTVDIDQQTGDIIVGLADGTITRFDKRLRPLRKYAGVPGMMPVLMMSNGTRLIAALSPQTGGAQPAPWVLDYIDGKWMTLNSATGAVAAQRRGKTIIVYKLHGSALIPQSLEVAQ